MNKSKVNVKISSWNDKYNIVTLESAKIEVVQGVPEGTPIKKKLINSLTGVFLGHLDSYLS